MFHHSGMKWSRMKWSRMKWSRMERSEPNGMEPNGAEWSEWNERAEWSRCIIIIDDQIFIYYSASLLRVITVDITPRVITSQ